MTDDRIDLRLRHHAEQWPDREAWIHDAGRWTYEEADHLIDQLARAFAAAGVGHGDRVAVFGKPRPEVIAIFLALGRIGAVYVGLNPKYRLAELRHIVGDCAPVALLTALAPTPDQASLLADLRALISPRLFLDVRVDGAQLANFLAGAPDDAPGRAAEAEDPALLVYTSGSTGTPKGALLPHRGLTFVAPIYNDVHNFGTVGPPRILCNLPINHVGCMVDICTNAIWAGGTLIFQEDFVVDDVLDVIERERLTVIGGIPVMFLAIVQSPRFAKTDLSSLQRIILGGNAAPLALVRTLRETAHCPVQTGYGLTECMGFSTFTAPDDSDEIVAGTVGRFDHRVEWRTADDAGLACPAGEPGEIQMRGDCVFSGYLGIGHPGEDVVTADGWFRTGDLAIVNPDQTVRLTGRRREMFKSGGYNVYPREIEQTLERLDGVAMAIVVPVPDENYGEVGYAFVVLDDERATADDLLVRARETLTGYKVPKHLSVEERLPMLPVGKVDRLALRALGNRRLSR